MQIQYINEMVILPELSIISKAVPAASRIKQNFAKGTMKCVRFGILLELDLLPGRKLDDLREYASEQPPFRMLNPKAVVMD
jgi:hypothetical protein